MKPAPENEHSDIRSTDETLSSLTWQDLSTSVDVAIWLKSVCQHAVLVITFAPCLVGTLLCGFLAVDGLAAGFSSGGGRRLEFFPHVVLPTGALLILTWMQLVGVASRGANHILGLDDPPSGKAAFQKGGSFLLAVFVVGFSFACAALIGVVIWFQEGQRQPLSFDNFSRFLTLNSPFVGIGWGAAFFPASIAVGFVVDRGTSPIVALAYAIRIIVSCTWLFALWIVVAIVFGLTFGVLAIPFGPWLCLHGIAIYFCATGQQGLLHKRMSEGKDREPPESSGP